MATECQSWTLWSRPANGAGGWVFEASYPNEFDAEIARRKLRKRDPEWQSSFLICEPGTSAFTPRADT